MRHAGVVPCECAVRTRRCEGDKDRRRRRLVAPRRAARAAPSEIALLHMTHTITRHCSSTVKQTIFSSAPRCEDELAREARMRFSLSVKDGDGSADRVCGRPQRVREQVVAGRPDLVSPRRPGPQHHHEGPLGRADKERIVFIVYVSGGKWSKMALLNPDWSKPFSSGEPFLEWRRHHSLLAADPQARRGHRRSAAVRGCAPRRLTLRDLVRVSRGLCDWAGRPSPAPLRSSTAGALA
jgi:hypothetical protein